MHISKLIELLAKALAEHGDLKVSVRNDAGDFDGCQTVRPEMHYSGNPQMSELLIDACDYDPTP